MSRNTIFMFILSMLMLIYIGFGVVISTRAAKDDKITGLDISLTEESYFVTEEDIRQECKLTDASLYVLRENFDLMALQNRLDSSDKIENVKVNLLANGHISVVAQPMIPVARVFEVGKSSYYINEVGKKMSATLQYRLDVPVISGYFDSIHPAVEILPIINYLANDKGAAALISGISRNKNGDIILAPTIIGHYVNFGDTSNITDKFKRLKSFYRHVAPYEGWNAYDTISVKWNKQVVAHLRKYKAKTADIPISNEYDLKLDFVDDETFIVPTDTTSLSNI